MARFKIQKKSSTLNWTGKKILGLHTGSIDIADGFIDMTEEKVNYGEILIDMTSIVVTDISDPESNQEFKDHLLNDDFFSVDRFPVSRLKVSAAVALGDNLHRVSGALTIKDITHPISFTSRIEIFTDFLHSLGEVVIDRTLYDIRYRSGKFIDNLGDKLVHDKFVLQFKLIGQRSN